MVCDESKLHITLYNRSRHAGYATEADNNRKLPCEAYNAVSMPSLQGRFHDAGSP